MNIGISMAVELPSIYSSIHCQKVSTMCLSKYELSHIFVRDITTSIQDIVVTCIHLQDEQKSLLDCVLPPVGHVLYGSSIYPD